MSLEGLLSGLVAEAAAVMVAAALIWLVVGYVAGRLGRR